MKLKNIIIPLSMLFTSTLLANTVLPEVNTTPTDIEITSKEGGKVSDGSTWNSKEMKGFPWILFYVDPDESDLNEELTERFKKEGINPSYMESVAVINLAATWKPNSIIGLILASKQKEFPKTLYVEDENSKLVKGWKLKDDDYVVIYFDKTNKVLFRKTGKFTTKDIDDLLKIIKDNAPKDAKPEFPNKK